MTRDTFGLPKEVRLFRFPLLEALTYSNPYVTTLFWLAVIFVALASVDWSAAASPWRLAAAAAASLLAWSLIEYLLHRFLFHFEATSVRGRALMFLLHDQHHQFPRQENRNMIVLAVSVPIAVAVYALLHASLPDAEAKVCFAALAVGYLTYDLTHYLIHMTTWRGVAALRRRHMVHHFVDDGKNFGVSGPLWDIVFGTLARDRPRHRPQRIAPQPDTRDKR